MKNLKKLREAKRLNQEGLAMAVNISQPTISLYETGDRTPDATTLLKFADFFNCSVDYLLGRTDVKQPVNDIILNNLNADELEIISVYRKLSTKNKNKVQGFVSALSE